MASVRQHILPRFLLKGFASRIEGKQTYTYVYLRDKMPFESNIINVGVEKYFYGKEGELYVDDDITKLENEYAPLLYELRENKRQVEISDPRIPELITHLVTRTKHLRDSYRESVEFLIKQTVEYFIDFGNIKQAILTSIKNKPEMMEDLIDEGFMDHPELRPFENILKPLFHSFFLAFFDTQKNESLLFAKYYFENIKRKLPKLLKEGHIRALSQGLTPEARVEDYQRLKWYLYKTAGSLILGDIGCLFETKGTKKFKSITFEDDQIKNVLLPISDRQLLIGTSPPEIPNVDLNLINEEIAKCSREFIICSNNSCNVASLVSLLGTSAEIYSKEEIERTANEIFSTYQGN